jgi:ATP-binding cassette, subfamily B, bacterial MsbA
VGSFINLLKRAKALLSVEWRTVAWILRLMAERKWLFIAIALAVLGSAFTEGFGIAVLVPLLDAVNRNANAFGAIPLLGRVADLFSGWPVDGELKVIALLFAGMALLRSAFNFATTMLVQLFGLRINQLLKLRVVRMVMGLDYERLEALGPATLLSYTLSMTEQAGAFVSLVATAAASVVMLLLYVGICFSLSWWMALVAGAAVLLAVQLVRLPLMRRMVEAGRRRTATLLEMNSIVLAGFSGAKLLRLVAGEERHSAKVQLKVDRYMANERRFNELQSLIDPMFQAAITLIIAILLYISAILLREQVAASIPVILLFLFVMSRIISPVQTLNRVRLSLAGALGGTHTLFGFLEHAAATQEMDGSRPFPGLRRGISIERLSFRYVLGGGSALEEVSFEIPASRITALVGSSGAGKTTVAALLARLYRPQSGRITVDGVDIAELTLREWRSHVAIVSQDTFLFDDTVAANLRLGRPKATNVEIEAAARRAEAHEFIMQLPAGYATVLGEGGVRLSAGQQQRLALARALVARPSLLILDEATSNLDAETEHLLSTALESIAQTCTLLVIAHRLATVQRADQIVVLERGRVVERGTHQSLMRAGGRYHSMVSLQNFAD